MRRQFPCGHSGKGQFCHRCAQEQREAAARRDEPAEARAWKATFPTDVIDLSAIQQYRALVEKARQIIGAIAGGASYTDFLGKRLQINRAVISIPVGQSYRLLYRDGAAGLEPLSLVSHERYNTDLRRVA
jgi:hypothetical protein